MNDKECTHYAVVNAAGLCAGIMEFSVLSLLCAVARLLLAHLASQRVHYNHNHIKPACIQCLVPLFTALPSGCLHSMGYLNGLLLAVLPCPADCCGNAQA